MALPITKTQRALKLLRSICSCKIFKKCSCPWTKRRNVPQQLVTLSTQQRTFLLPQERSTDKHCLVIDLDETLVHSSFEPIENPDFTISIELNNATQTIYVLKRPYVDEFLQRMGKIYECVLFTASLAMYADQLTNLLDKWDVFTSRLYRESCTFQQNCYIKDLSRLGRNLERVVILDNSPVSYLFHPENAVPVASWFEDKNDTQLLYIIPFLERLAKTDNVYSILRNSNHPLNDTNQKKNLTKDFLNPA